MADKKVNIDIVIEAANSAKTVKDLKTSVDDLKNAAEGLDTTSAEFKKLSTEIVKADGKLQSLNKSFVGLDPNAKAGELGKLAGGLGAVGSAAALAFADNKNAEEFFKTFAQGIAITNAAKGSIEAYTSSSALLQDSLKKGGIAAKVAGAAQAAYSTIVGTSTGALKLFRIALAATGIGAIVIAIVALIANFKEISEWVQKTINRFEFLQAAVEPLIWAFNAIKEGLQSLGLIDDAQTEKAKVNAQSRLDNAIKEQKAIGDKYDFEIAKAKAAGKNTFELEQKKREAILETLKTQALAIVEQAKLQGEFTDEMKEKLEGIKTLAINTAKEIKIAEIENSTKSRDEQVKNYEKVVAANKKKEEELLKDAQKQRDAAKELRDVRAQIAGDEIEIERNKWDDKIALIAGKSQEEKDLIVALEFQKTEAIAKIKKDADDKKLADDKAHAENEIALGLELKQMRIDAGLGNEFATPEELQELFEQKEGLLLEQRTQGLISEEEYVNQKNKLKQDEVNSELAASKAKAEIQKADIDRANQAIQLITGLVGESKGAQIASLVAESAGGVAKSIISNNIANQAVLAQATLSAGLAGPALAAPFIARNNISTGINIASIVVATAKGIQGINSAKPSGGGSGGGLGGFSAPSAPPAPTFNDETLNGPSDGTPDITREGGGLGRNQQPMRAYIVQQDIEDSGEEINKIRDRAQF